MRIRQTGRPCRRGVVVVLAVLAVVVGGCSSGTESSSGTASGVLKAGDLLTIRPVTSVAALPSAASNHVITYMSDSSSEKAIVVSGIVSVPAGKPPQGGWPVVSWAHGTTGWADTCAPSVDTPSQGRGKVQVEIDHVVTNGTGHEVCHRR